MDVTATEQALVSNEPVTLIPNRAEQRRSTKKTLCALCVKPMAAGERMAFKLPDPRQENWGLMTTAEGHARCVALAERRRAEAAERALAALSEAAKTQQAATETATRQQAMGLWTPR